MASRNFVPSAFTYFIIIIFSLSVNTKLKWFDWCITLNFISELKINVDKRITVGQVKEEIGKIVGYCYGELQNENSIRSGSNTFKKKLIRTLELYSNQIN